jgi:glutathione synthase/RimK-type ligase-like ATP-grasp enzyme
MIVLWGLMEDGPLGAVRQRLEEMGIRPAFIDQRHVPEYDFELETGVDEGGRITGPGCSVETDDVRAIYARPYSFADLDTLSGLDPASAAWQRAAGFEMSMLAWCDMTGALVVNRPASMGSNQSKPYQLDIIRKAGFRVPETLITTDPATAAAFRERHREVIYKSVSSWRSIVSRMSEQDLLRLDDVTCCPTQFQRFIEGTDYRVHVVNEVVYAHRIDCTDDDYRYSQQTRMEPVQLDGSLEKRCVALARELTLEFAGIDLRLSADGAWYCFEVNPSPGFTYFDGPSGAISLAVAQRLAEVQ